MEPIRMTRYHGGNCNQVTKKYSKREGRHLGTLQPNVKADTLIKYDRQQGNYDIMLIRVHRIRRVEWYDHCEDELKIFWKHSAF